jgi:hypothetical protein
MLLGLTMTLLMAMTGSVQATAKTKVKPPVHSGMGTVATTLTEAECTGLGGKVVTVLQGCSATGKVCYTTDKNGVIHHACITKK